MIDEYEHLTSKPFSDAHDDFSDKYVAALYWAVSKFCGSDWLSEIESTRKMHIISYMIIAYFIEGSLLGAWTARAWTVLSYDFGVARAWTSRLYGWRWPRTDRRIICCGGCVACGVGVGLWVELTCGM